VRVFAGTDPVSKKDLYLTQVVPPGPRQAREAEQARTRLLNQVDEKRNPKTRATVDQLIAKYFEVADIDTQTMRGYKSKYENHIKPLIGSQQLARLDIEILDSFYSQLRTCRDHCRGRKYIQHRTDKPHQCDEHVGDRGLTMVSDRSMAEFPSCKADKTIHAFNAYRFRRPEGWTHDQAKKA